MINDGLAVYFSNFYSGRLAVLPFRGKKFLFFPFYLYLSVCQNNKEFF